MITAILIANLNAVPAMENTVVSRGDEIIISPMYTKRGVILKGKEKK